MSDFTNGYVTSYTKNSNGTYSCSLVTASPLIDTSPSIITNTPSSSYSSPPTITNNITCVGILNTNMIISPNNPLQSIVMSNNHKYIFIPTYADETPKLMFHKILGYYITVYSILHNNTNIPLMNNYLTLFISSQNFTNPNNDSVYNSIPTSRESLRVYYGAYLIGIKPTSELLKLNPNASQWNDAGQLYLTIYNFYEKNDVKNTIIIPKDNGIIPNNICIQTDSTDVIPSINPFDCRNVPDGSSLIKPVNNMNIFGSSSSSSSSSSYSLCCCIIFFLFFGGDKTVSRRRRR